MNGELSFKGSHWGNAEVKVPPEGHCTNPLEMTLGLSQIAASPALHQVYLYDIHVCRQLLLLSQFTLLHLYIKHLKNSLSQVKKETALCCRQCIYPGEIHHSSGKKKFVFMSETRTLVLRPYVAWDQNTCGHTGPMEHDPY